MRLERGTEVSASDQNVSAERTSATDHASGIGGNTVEVRVAAEATQLAVLRAVVGDLAMRADFDVDAIADLRLAVDEACSSLVRLAEPAGTLVCRFQASANEIAIAAEVTSVDSSGPNEDTLSWRVLDALADSLTTSVDPSPNQDGHVVRIDLSKARAVGG